MGKKHIMKLVLEKTDLSPAKMIYYSNKYLFILY